MCIYLNKGMRPLNEKFSTFPLMSVLFMIGEDSFCHRGINGLTLEKKFRGDKIVFWCTYPTKKKKDDLIILLCKMARCLMAKCHVSKENFVILRETEKLNDPKLRKYSFMIKFIDHQAEIKRNS
jgi:hypothetical protein